MLLLSAPSVALASWWERKPNQPGALSEKDTRTIDRLMKNFRAQADAQSAQYSQPYVAPKPKAKTEAPAPSLSSVGPVLFPVERAPNAQIGGRYINEDYVPRAEREARVAPISPSAPVDSYIAPVATTPEPVSAPKLTPWHQLVNEDAAPAPVKRSKKRGARKSVKKQVKKDPRRLASLAPVNTEKAAPLLDTKRVGEPRLVLGLSGGYNSVSSGSAYQVGQGSAALTSDNHFTLGLNGQYRQPYWAVEADTYIGISTRPLPGDAAVSHTAVFADVKVQYPLHWGSVRIRPYAGLGYGLTSVAQATTGDSGLTSKGALNVNGVYGVFGVEVNPFSRVSFRADYAHSLSASGSRVNGGQIAEGGDAAFDRLRFGLFYELGTSYQIGFQYILRAATLDQSNGSTEISDQMSAAFLFQF